MKSHREGFRLVKVLVIYSSKGGSTKRLAECIAQGVKEIPEAEVDLMPVTAAKCGDLGNYDGIIAGSPAYFGSMAADLKALFDESIQIRGQLADKVGAAYATSAHSSGGKETTIMSILQAMLIHQMIIVGDPLESGGHYGVAVLGTDVDRERVEARAFGRRVAEVARKIKQG